MNQTKSSASHLSTRRYAYCPKCDEEFEDAMIFEELSNLECDNCGAQINCNQFLVEITGLPFRVHNLKASYDRDVSHLCFLEELREQDLCIYLQEKHDNIETVEKLIHKRIAHKCPHCMSPA